MGDDEAIRAAQEKVDRADRRLRRLQNIELGVYAFGCLFVLVVFVAAVIAAYWLL